MEYDSVASPTDCCLVVATADVAGFAKAVAGRTSRETFDMLQAFYESTGHVIESAGGKVVKFMGDAALICFPAEDADRAVEALRDLRAKAQECWSSFSETCQVRIKAHIGTVTCGPLGTAGEKRFDVIGSSVNDLFLMPGGDLALSDELREALGEATE